MRESINVTIFRIIVVITNNLQFYFDLRYKKKKMCILYKNKTNNYCLINSFFFIHVESIVQQNSTDKHGKLLFEAYKRKMVFEN